MARNHRGGRIWATFLCCLFAMPACAKILPGVSAEPLSSAVLAGALLGACYLLLRPVLRLLTFPVGCVTLGLSGFVIDCALIWAMTQVIPGFTVAGIEYMALCALLVDGLCLAVGGTR